MNAYVKSLQTRAISLRWMPVSLSAAHWCVMTLAMAVLVSSFSLVYLKDMNRRLMNQAQDVQTQSMTLHSRWSQLLDQRGSLASQSRVAQLAAKKYQMVMPKPDKIVMISA